MARQIGLEKLYYAVLKKDDGTGVEYDALVEIPQIIELSTTDTSAEYTFYSNNRIEESKKKTTGSDLEIELGYMTPKLESDLLGKKMDKGKKYTSTNDVAREVALLYSVSKSDGTFDYRVFYKTSLARTERKNKTSEDNIESANVKLTGKAIPLANNNHVDMEISTDCTVEGAKEIIDNFFKKVQL